jgi:hypothetical protein
MVWNATSRSHPSSCNFILRTINRNPYGIIVDGARRPTTAHHSYTPTLTTNSCINTKFEHAKVRNYFCLQLVLMFSFSVVTLVGV